jgi:hypothetical protein
MLGPEIPVLYERVEFGTSARFAFVHAGPTSRNAPFGGFDEVIYRLSTSPRVEFNPRQSPPPPGIPGQVRARERRHASAARFTGG